MARFDDKVLIQEQHADIGARRKGVTGPRGVTGDGTIGQAMRAV